MPMTFLTIVAHTDLPGAAALNAIRSAVRSGDPAALASNLVPLREVAGGTIATRRLALVLMLLFAALALGLSALGAYGVMAYIVTQRTTEIGVRMALGASPSDLLRLIVGQGIRTAVGGTSVGLLAALLAARVLASLLYNVGTVDLWVELGIAVLTMLVAAIASYLPARRAIRMNPLSALRQD
jgi:ABC-type antimicrobial peptide transport system permease subunit